MQPLWMLIDGSGRVASGRERIHRAVGRLRRLLVACAVLLVYASYWFVMEPPQAHAFYVLAPIALMFARSGGRSWTRRGAADRGRRAGARHRLSRRAGVGAAAGAVALQESRVVAAAVATEPEMFAHRRDFAIDGGPVGSRRSVAAVRSDARHRQCSSARERMGPAGSLHWTVMLRNRSASSPFATRCYITTYLDEHGASSRSVTSGSRTSSSRATLVRSSSTTASPGRRFRARSSRHRRRRGADPHAASMTPRFDFTV